jgi:hypothetical protein
MTPTHFADRLRSAATPTRVPARISRRRRLAPAPQVAERAAAPGQGGEQFAARLRAALPAKAGVRR